MRDEQQQQDSRRQISLAIIAGATVLSLIVTQFVCVATAAAVSEAVQASTCRRELENANKSMTKWAENMEEMVNESKLPAQIRESIHNEANKILDLIEDFNEEVKTKQPSVLARDLVNIRKRSNRMALDIYLNTFDMRWPQNSLQVGVIVERVQQACLDRNTVLEFPSSPLEVHL